MRLSFANSTTSGNHLREQVQQFLQQTFAEIGVEMTISNLPAAVMWGEFWQQSQFNSVIVGSAYLIGADPDVTNRLHSGSIVAKGGRGSRQRAVFRPRKSTRFSGGRRPDLLIQRHDAGSTSRCKSLCVLICHSCHCTRTLPS